MGLERTDLELIVLRVSPLASNEDLALLATADILGRYCDDQPRAERVPERVLERVLEKIKDRWEAPDLTEAHRVERVDTERFVD